ncbi:MAG: hypothetical protein IPP99_05675 [Chitinophagaceae bacterium]|nr:hypothetical protein [Chitinophagaceae bacterium]
MQDSNTLTLIIAGVSLIISILSIVVSSKYSKITLIHSLHELVLQKAKDCNALFEIARNTENQSLNELLTEIKMTDAISELTISIQLIDQSLKAYGLDKRIIFFHLQFWTQLNTTFRIFIKRGNFTQFPKATQEQLSNIERTFSNFFKQY